MKEINIFFQKNLLIAALYHQYKLAFRPNTVDLGRLSTLNHAVQDTTLTKSSSLEELMNHKHSMIAFCNERFFILSE